jgi:hypothetical protein
MLPRIRLSDGGGMRAEFIFCLSALVVPTDGGEARHVLAMGLKPPANRQLTDEECKFVLADFVAEDAIEVYAARRPPLSRSFEVSRPLDDPHAS